MDFEGAKKHILNRLRSELANNLYYHGVHHTLDVFNAVEMISALEGIEGDDFLLVKTAVLYHDAGFIENYNEHEKLGAEIAKRELPRFGYSDKNIEEIYSIILATGINCTPQTPLEMIMCDADYDYLGRDDFHAIANTLLQELKEYGYEFTNKQWDKIQVNFLDKHTYNTESSQKLREKKKQQNLFEVKERLKTYN